MWGKLGITVVSFLYICALIGSELVRRDYGDEPGIRLLIFSAYCMGTYWGAWCYREYHSDGAEK